MQQGDHAGEDPTPEKDPRPERSPVDHRFAAIVAALRAADPHFARRVAEPRRLGSGPIMMLTGLAAALLLGVLPLAVGIQTQLEVLLVTGALGIALTPVIVAMLVGVLLHRVRPAW